LEKEGADRPGKDPFGEMRSGVLWFTMLLIEGESLRDRLRRQH